MPAVLVCLVLAAPPTDAVQTFDLGRMSWQQAKALDGRRVRARFVITRFSTQRDGVLVLVDGPVGTDTYEMRLVTLSQGGVPPLAKNDRLTAEGVLRVTWRLDQFGDSVWFIVELENARLVK